MARAREPWERRDGETEAAYARFREYLGCDPPRPRKMLAERWGISPGSLDVQAHKHEWTARARAWDAESQRRADEALLSEAAEVKRQISKVQDTLRERGLQLVETGDGEAGDGARMLDLWMRNKRLELGLATERLESTVETVAGEPDLSLLTDEEAAEFRRLLAKAMGCADE